MTLAEAQAILFVGQGLTDLVKSLRDDQVAALAGILDIRQQTAFLEIASVVRPVEEGAFVVTPRSGWVSLVEASKERIAVSEDPLRPSSP